MAEIWQYLLTGNGMQGPRSNARAVLSSLIRLHQNPCWFLPAALIVLALATVIWPHMLNGCQVNVDYRTKSKTKSEFIEIWKEKQNVIFSSCDPAVESPLSCRTCAITELKMIYFLSLSIGICVFMLTMQRCTTVGARRWISLQRERGVWVGAWIRSHDLSGENLCHHRAGPQPF